MAFGCTGSFRFSGGAAVTAFNHDTSGGFCAACNPSYVTPCSNNLTSIPASGNHHSASAYPSGNSAEIVAFSGQLPCNPAVTYLDSGAINPAGDSSAIPDCRHLAVRHFQGGDLRTVSNGSEQALILSSCCSGSHDTNGMAISPEGSRIRYCSVSNWYP